MKKRRGRRPTAIVRRPPAGRATAACGTAAFAAAAKAREARRGDATAPAPCLTRRQSKGALPRPLITVVMRAVFPHPFVMSDQVKQLRTSPPLTLPAGAVTRTFAILAEWQWKWQAEGQGSHSPQVSGLKTSPERGAIATPISFAAAL